MFKALWFGLLVWAALVFLPPQLAANAGTLAQPLWLAQAAPKAIESRTAPPQPTVIEPDASKSERDRLDAPHPQSDNQTNLDKTNPGKTNPLPASQATRSNPYDMEALKAFDAGSHRAN